MAPLEWDRQADMQTAQLETTMPCMTARTWEWEGKLANILTPQWEMRTLCMTVMMPERENTLMKQRKGRIKLAAEGFGADMVAKIPPWVRTALQNGRRLLASTVRKRCAATTAVPNITARAGRAVEVNCGVHMAGPMWVSARMQLTAQATAREMAWVAGQLSLRVAALLREHGLTINEARRVKTAMVAEGSCGEADVTGCGWMLHRDLTSCLLQAQRPKWHVKSSQSVS